VVPSDVSSGTLVRLGVMLCGVFSPFILSSAHRGKPSLSLLAHLPALMQTRDGLDATLCDAGCAAMYPNPDERAAAAFIRSRTSNDDAIFSGLIDRHGYPANDVRAYWMCNRRVGTRHAIL